MKKTLKRIFIQNKIFLSVLDTLWSPVTLLSAVWLKLIRNGLRVLPVSDKIFMTVGILPVNDHYYQPMINPKKYLKDELKRDRKLPGVDLNNDDVQLNLLLRFHYNDELLSFPREKRKELEYYYNNTPFGPGDAEYLYNMVRHFKPKQILEIGCGNSTLMIRNAVKNNTKDDPSYKCEHICIEPYEMDWLEQVGIKVIREKVEDVDLSVFTSLEANDILFIDSSHMIRPQGDVVFEFLQLLPIVKPGVIIHVHDIFTPHEYPDDWLNRHRLWNEQYLLEAFLTCNNQFEIIGALNYLFHKHKDKMIAKCPVLGEEKNWKPARLEKDWEPASFWMVRK